MLVRISAVSGYVPPIEQIRVVNELLYVEIGHLDELWQLRTDVGSRIIIDTDGETPILLIYDDYLE